MDNQVNEFSIDPGRHMQVIRFDQQQPYHHYNLIGSEYDRITPMEGEQHYIFALGDNEIEVRIDKSDNNEQHISFSNLDYLADLKASDYLTLSLYLNQDSHNLLWNWGFTTLDVDVDLDEDNNNGTDLPDRSLLEEQIESITQHSGKRNFLNNGDVNNNGIPDFAEFEYTIVPEPNIPMGRSALFSAQSVEHHFVPIVVEIPEHIDLTDSTATLQFYYDGSDPLAVKIEEQIYTPATGNMRLWAKDASEKRNPSPYQNGGDYLEPTQAYSSLLAA